MNIISYKQSIGTYWDEKPVWCQPWSIVITGLSIIALSIWWPNSILLTAIITLIVVLWWALFLIIAPLQYSNHKADVYEIEKK